MRMVETAARYRGPRRHPADADNRGIEQRHQHDQNWHDITGQARVTGKVAGMQRYRTQEKPDRERTAVTHEYRCWMEIVNKESRQRPGDYQSLRRPGQIAVQVR